MQVVQFIFALSAIIYTFSTLQFPAARCSRIILERKLSMHKSLKCKKSLSLFCAITLLFASVAAAIPIHSFADNSPAVWDGTSSTAPTKGNGSENDPYIIETAAELYYVVFEAGEETKNKYPSIRRSG